MMNNEQSNIERIVMRRVHRIAFLRPLISGGALSLVLLAAALWGIGRFVWVSRVIENMPQGDMAALAQFLFSAFSYADFMVQALTLVVAFAVIHLARALARALAAPILPLRA